VSTRRRLREFLVSHEGRTSEEWRRQIAGRAREWVKWPDPWVIAHTLGVTVRVVPVSCLRYGTVDDEVWIGDHPDRRVLGHRLATALAQHLLKLSNASWTKHDEFLLAFELLMPTDSVLETPEDQLCACQPHAYPALVTTWAEHIRAAKSA
jgi:hypothetical protein